MTINKEHTKQIKDTFQPFLSNRVGSPKFDSKIQCADLNSVTESSVFPEYLHGSRGNKRCESREQNT